MEWSRLCLAARPAGVLVVTTHREGRLPMLHRCTTSAALLGELAGELVGELAGELVPPAVLASVSFADLFARQEGNIRTALRALYDRFADG